MDIAREGERVRTRESMETRGSVDMDWFKPARVAGE